MTRQDQTIRSCMQHTPVTVHPTMPIADALNCLLDKGLSTTAVVDGDKRILGVLSVHDVLVELWCSDYRPAPGRLVKDVMRQEVETVSPDATLDDLVEQMCIDKQALFPVSDMGIALRLTSKRLSERAREPRVNRPTVYPVAEDGILVGLLSRDDLIRGLRPLFGKRVKPVDSEPLAARA